MDATLNRHQVRTIVDYLDMAMKALVDARFESHPAWCVRMARERLLDAAIAPITIQQQEAA